MLTSARTAKDWEDGLKTLEDQGQGVMHMHLISPLQASVIMNEAMAGDDMAIRLYLMIVEALRECEQRPADNPIQCLCCHKPLSPHQGKGFCFVTSGIDQPTVSVVALLCQPCFNAPDRAERIVGELRGVWPTIAMKRVSSEPGQA